MKAKREPSKPDEGAVVPQEKSDWMYEMSQRSKAPAVTAAVQPEMCVSCSSQRLFHGMSEGKPSSRCRDCGTVMYWGDVPNLPDPIPGALEGMRQEHGGARGFMQDSRVAETPLRDRQAIEARENADSLNRLGYGR